MPPSFPRPCRGHLTLYLGGGAGGVGESIVMHMPDGRWVVVDVCSCHDKPKAQGWNFPLEVLRTCEAEYLDLMVLTHPDADHFSGLQSLIGTFSGKIGAVWTFPRRNMREMALRAHDTIQNHTTNARYQLFEFLDYTIQETHGLDPVQPRFPTSVYPSTSTGYQLRAVFPTQQDMRRLEAEARMHAEDLNELGRGRGGRAVAPQAETTRALLAGRQPELEANMLSLGLVIEWGGIKVFLPGDMEVEADRLGNWAGMLDELDRRDETQGLLNDMAVVKAPHHGSRSASGTALHEPTWDRMCGARGRVPLVLLTPKNGGGNPPPQQEGLAWLAERTHWMGVTAAPRPSNNGWAHVTAPASGWHDATAHHPASEVGSWLMLDISPHGYIQRRAGALARWFVQRR
jgi:hypothetical protein